MIFFYISVILCKAYLIKRYGSEEYFTGSFDPISLPTLGPKIGAHVYEIAHPENDSRVSIFRLACVPRTPVIPDVVLDATKENDKVTYFTYNPKLKNEEIFVVRYEDGVLLSRGNECITYNRDQLHFYTTICTPKHPEQLFELVETRCSVPPEKMDLDKFIDQPPPGMIPLIKID